MSSDLIWSPVTVAWETFVWMMPSRQLNNQLVINAKVFNVLFAFIVSLFLCVCAGIKWIKSLIKHLLLLASFCVWMWTDFGLVVVFVFAHQYTYIRFNIWLIYSTSDRMCLFFNLFYFMCISCWFCHCIHSLRN